MSTRALAVLVAALLVAGLLTLVFKDGDGEDILTQPPTPTLPETPTEPVEPTATMTFDGPAPLETPPTVQPTSTPTGPLPRTGGSSAWPPAAAALGLSALAGLALRRATGGG